MDSSKENGDGAAMSAIPAQQCVPPRSLARSHNPMEGSGLGTMRDERGEEGGPVGAGV
jgi:hypothetical protein